MQPLVCHAWSAASGQAANCMQFATKVRAADASPTRRAAMLRLPTLIAVSTADDGHPPPAAPVFPTECQAALTTAIAGMPACCCRRHRLLGKDTRPDPPQRGVVAIPVTYRRAGSAAICPGLNAESELLHGTATLELLSGRSIQLGGGCADSGFEVRLWLKLPHSLSGHRLRTG